MSATAQFRAAMEPVAFARVVIALLAIFLTVWSQWLPAPIESHLADEWLRDRFIRLHVDPTPETRIAVVDIDESSLATLGPWPWSRQRIATLLENLIAHYGARGVGLDMPFPEPADSDGDARLAALTQYGPVVLAQAFDYSLGRSAPLRVGQLSGGIITEPGDRGHTPTITATGFIGNHAGLRQARHTGNIGFEPDAEDGAIRLLPLRTSFEGQVYPALTLALLECCSGGKTEMKQHVDYRSEAHSLWRIPFNRDLTAFEVIPAAEILNLSAPVAAVSGRLVLVGSSSLGLSDRLATPLGPSTSGLMVHAEALSALLDEQSGQAPRSWPGRWIALLFTALVAVQAIFSFPRLSATANVIILAALSLLWLPLAYWISPHDPALAPAGPLISNLFLLAVAVPFDWQVTQRESHRLLNTLRQYVAKSVVDELLQHHLKDPLAPVQREVTTLIADMEGYTGQVESLSMEEASQLTRDFLDCLTRPVLSAQGTLDKYTGDGLVAFWGAPLPNPDHADLAMDAAQGILREVRRLSDMRVQAGHQPLRVRIGIESGPAMVGDFGSEFRSIYTAVGDSVNVASRLEQMARDLPHDVIVGEGTASRIKRHTLTLLGDKLLRGKENPTTLYTLAT